MMSQEHGLGSSSMTVRRIISGVAAIGLLLFSAVFTLGTSLAAPFGIFLGQRLALRKRRRFTGIYSWFSAVAASTIAVLAALTLVISLIPKEEWQQIQQAMADASAKQTASSPTLPRPDPMTEKVIQSPAFTMTAGLIGLVIGCLFLGVFAGTPGWVATLLLGYALRGRTAVDAPLDGSGDATSASVISASTLRR